MYGYEMIKSLEIHPGCPYKPSAGAIYPTFQMPDGPKFIEPIPEGR